MMSAFMVEPKTLNRIAGTLADLPTYGYGVRMYLKRESDFFIESMSVTEREDAARKLADELAKMNTDALVARYNGGAARMKGPDTHPFSWENFEDDFQFLKSLDCYLYQCSEGDIPERPLFKRLDHIRNCLARLLVTESKEYERAQWA